MFFDMTCSVKTAAPKRGVGGWRPIDPVRPCAHYAKPPGTRPGGFVYPVAQADSLCHCTDSPVLLHRQRRRHRVAEDAVAVFGLGEQSIRARRQAGEGQLAGENLTGRFFLTAEIAENRRIK